MSKKRKQSKSIERLIEAAVEAQKRAYCPYSRYPVGAAVLTETGRVFAGCNVENASYGATICAERTAILTMVAAGLRSVESIAVFTDAETLAMPCGLCRQVISEFQRDAVLIVANPRQHRVLRFAEIFPEPFVLER